MRPPSLLFGETLAIGNALELELDTRQT